jgi:DNA-binding cell septation regulator SpoVG
LSHCFRVALLITLAANIACAAIASPSAISVTSITFNQGGKSCEITLNNSLAIREINILNVGGRALLKFPESISKRGKVFPQVRLASRPAREAVYSAVKNRAASSQWGPLSFKVAKITRYTKKSALKAFAVVVFGDGVEIESRVVSGSSGLFVGWPARKVDGQWLDQVTITDPEFRAEVEAAVLAAYEK